VLRDADLGAPCMTADSASWGAGHWLLPACLEHGSNYAIRVTALNCPTGRT
jgi:hypothetical protein